MARKKEDLASRLRHRITIERMITTSDGAGGASYNWEKVGDYWAEVVPQKPTEIQLGEQSVPIAVYVITMRYQAGINSSMRVKFSGRIFNMKGIWVEKEEDKVLQIIAEENIFI